MPTPQELEAKFWKALKSDMTMMLGLDGVEDRPRAADDGASRRRTQSDLVLHGEDNELCRTCATARMPIATLHRRVTICSPPFTAHSRLDNDRAVIERLWNPFVAAWFKGGKDDPNLALLRFDAERAEIWLNEYSLFAGVKMLLGADPKKDYQDKVAEVSLS